jgi:hypothetical protein
LASKNTNPLRLASLASFFSRSLTLSIFLAMCFLTWRVKIRTTRQFGECLEKLVHTPV